MHYDEFALFQENAVEAELPWSGAPRVERRAVQLANGRAVSALVWEGDHDAELVLIHGGAQNAHTWDTVALALGRPLVAIDLPGHGHSDWRPAHDYWPERMADDVAVAIGELAPNASLVVGMSLGGLTALALSARHSHHVRRLALVDVTPGSGDKGSGIGAFIRGPESFPSFEAILERTIRYNPRRSESALRRGVLHNARPLPDGSWSWRYDPARRWTLDPGQSAPDFGALWKTIDALRVPLMLVRGGDSQTVDDADEAELRRRNPGARVERVEGAGHNVQGERPLELARLIDAFARA